MVFTTILFILFLGTTIGLHMAYYDAETYQFESILLDSIGGNPALIVKDNVISSLSLNRWMEENFI